ncbi:hypothetical protein [Paraglaciecola hydrolytica]|uniref:STAS/SEC14 domain-containing protein n=1 Tax=Paraglaciecola hydrolytica TaxID=1799789 RepID=A0A135ZYV7_9ALTE|nr:hypothetical protein [Paraglaciecola hydrolytica]KXI28060.1 hypothetical protein AX660_16865 [Paraglaciecola hydrolytica]
MNKAHGEYKLVLSGNIMFTVALGPWNAECVDSFMQDYYQLILPLHGSRWGNLIILHGESLLIPAAEYLLAKAVMISVSQGLTDVAIVLSNSSVQTSTEAQFLNVYKSSGLNLRTFQCDTAALAWLIQQGLRCDDGKILRNLA